MANAGASSHHTTCERRPASSEGSWEAQFLVAERGGWWALLPSWGRKVRRQVAGTVTQRQHPSLTMTSVPTGPGIYSV